MTLRVMRITAVLWAAAFVGAAWGAGEPGAGRKYAPDRKVDILHVVIDVRPDFAGRKISGTTKVRFSPIAQALKELRLDAVDLRVSSVESPTKLEGWQATQEQVMITFATAVPPGAASEVVVSYETEPRRGLYFRTPEMGYRPEDMHLWTQGETEDGRYWYPCFDYPNERFTSEVICHVPQDMTVLSNGKLVSETPEGGAGLKAVRWVQDKPHVNYLIALAAGRFKGIHGKYREIPLGFYTPASQIGEAENSFRGTDDMMGFFEREIGVAYPWDKYDQVVVDDFIHGGMENTTLTVLTDRTLFTSASENIRSSQGLVSHELVHQWFGNYVTCKDWSHVWLNEGFATYYAHLYDGSRNGRDSMLYGLYQDAGRILDAGDDARPIVYRVYERPFEQFGYRAYQKGGWVLHMLRTQVGEEVFRRCIRTYLERYALQSVVTEDLVAVVEEVTGRSFDRFFDQWVYHGRQPSLEVSTSWNQTDKLAKVTVKQTHEVNDKVLLFAFGTKVRFRCGGAAVDREIMVDQKEQDFYFALPEAPTVVRFDPEYGLLAKVAFDKPTETLYAQLEEKEDVIGRILAAEGLKSKKDRATVEKLKGVLAGDAFYGVRIAASKALREIHTPEAFEALAASRTQPDARVRQRVVEDIGGFYQGESLAIIKEVVKSEKNPEILAVAIAALGKYPDKDTEKLLAGLLKSDSYRNRLAEAAIGAIRSLDDPGYACGLMKVLGEREGKFTSGGFAVGLDALAYISRNEDDRDAVRSFLARYVNHKKQAIQTAAITALGTLRDPKAIPVVETFRGDRQDDPVQRAARDALQTLRDAKKVPVELSDLRKEVLELKKADETMKKDVEDLKKKLEAREKQGAETRPATAASGR